jgi:hypothetical protein
MLTETPASEEEKEEFRSEVTRLREFASTIGISDTPASEEKREMREDTSMIGLALDIIPHAGDDESEEDGEDDDNGMCTCILIHTCTRIYIYTYSYMHIHIHAYDTLVCARAI